MKHRIQISEEFWSRIQPLLPAVERYPKSGRPRLDDRRALNGIVFVLSTGLPWEDLPQEMGCGMTC
jgi:transposase